MQPVFPRSGRSLAALVVSIFVGVGIGAALGRIIFPSGVLFGGYFGAWIGHKIGFILDARAGEQRPMNMMERAFYSPITAAGIVLGGLIATYARDHVQQSLSSTLPLTIWALFGIVFFCGAFQIAKNQDRHAKSQEPS
jgi:hypothetical protein